MEKAITSQLEKKDFESEFTFKKFVSKLKLLIDDYESELYDTDTYTKENQKKVTTWRRQLHKMTQGWNKELDETPEILNSTVNIIHRQISKVDRNTSLLSKGTLKLMGLDYTNTDIKSALNDTRKKILKDKQLEQKEIILMYTSFVIFLISCLFILFDKFILKL